MNNDVLDQIVSKIRKNHRCVVLTGAGISAESGVPTFRGKEGLWGKFKPEELATMDAFISNPQIVWEWYNWRRKLIADVKPNPGHYALVEMETWFDNFTLVTQNVDGLHRMAGSQEILELHGNINRNKCIDCSRSFPEDVEIDPHRIPACPHCGGKIRPDVVWFGEMLDPKIINSAFNEAARADIFLSVGTSAVVQPAASLPIEARRAEALLVEINVEKTPLSFAADFHVPAPSGEFLPKVVERLKQTVP